jgi:Zn-dependent protease
MSWSFSIGTVLGSELRVHATFLLLLAWIGTAAFASGGPIAAMVNVAFVVALFACVVAHEFGHALMARRFGVRTPDITLLPIGGMARLEKIPEAPAQEIAVALAGPAVNIVIWAGLTLLFGAGDSLSTLGAIDDTGEGFVARLAAINLFLAVFNMIPAFPMDGGRVLRAALATRMDRVLAPQDCRNRRTGDRLRFRLSRADDGQSAASADRHFRFSCRHGRKLGRRAARPCKGLPCARRYHHILRGAFARRVDESRRKPRCSVRRKPSFRFSIQVSGWSGSSRKPPSCRTPRQAIPSNW